MDLLENVNDPEYIRNYIEEYGKPPPKPTIDFKRALRINKQKMRRLAELSVTVAVAYKAFFYFVRSFHDINYKVLLLLTGNKYSWHSSMIKVINEKEKCFNRENPVGKILSVSFPEYIDWFLDFREMRNSIKTGILTSAILVEADPSIQFIKLGELGYHPIKTYSVSDLVVAINNTTKLTQIVYHSLITQ